MPVKKKSGETLSSQLGKHPFFEPAAKAKNESEIRLRKLKESDAMKIGKRGRGGGGGGGLGGVNPMVFDKASGRMKKKLRLN